MYHIALCQAAQRFALKYLFQTRCIGFLHRVYAHSNHTHQFPTSCRVYAGGLGFTTNLSATQTHCENFAIGGLQALKRGTWLSIPKGTDP